MGQEVDTYPERENLAGRFADVDIESLAMQEHRRAQSSDSGANDDGRLAAGLDW